MNIPIKEEDILESYMIDRTKGIYPPKGFEEYPDGTWFMVAKVPEGGYKEPNKEEDIKV